MPFEISASFNLTGLDFDPQNIKEIINKSHEINAEIDIDFYILPENIKQNDQRLNELAKFT